MWKKMGNVGRVGATLVRPGPRKATNDRPGSGEASFAAPYLLRMSLGLVFVWFGALKVAGVSPVETLLVTTIPFLPAGVVVPLLGAVETVVGLLVVLGRWQRVVLVVLAAHLCGTFLTFVVARDLVTRNGNPLLLTDLGEFVVKNIVLISAVLVLLELSFRSGRGGAFPMDLLSAARRPTRLVLGTAPAVRPAEVVLDVPGTVGVAVPLPGGEPGPDGGPVPDGRAVPETGDPRP